MKSSITIFLIGVVLGSTLGISGLWTQVVQPAYGEIKELEDEHKVMQSALDEAGETLKEVSVSLRADESAVRPMGTAEIIPGMVRPGVSPTSPTEQPSATTRARDRKQIADRLDTLATKLNKARSKR